jgi:hypothetical protein
MAVRAEVQRYIGGNPVNWENPIIGEQNEIRFVVEPAYSIRIETDKMQKR